jgi:hypothetical protein
MTLHTALLASSGLFAALVLGACSHDWDALDPGLAGSTSGTGASGSGAGGAGAGGTDTGAGGTSSTTSTAHTGGSGGSGGSGNAGGTGGSGAASSGGGGTGGEDCAPPLLPPVPRCDVPIQAFNDQAAFETEWDYLNDPNDVLISNGVANFHIPAATMTTLVATKKTFVLQGCGVWAQIVEAAPDESTTTRLSLGVPGDVSYYVLGVTNGELQARIDNSVEDSKSYDPAAMRYVRIREDDGEFAFDYSADGHCWTKLTDTFDTIPVPLQARLGITHAAGGQGLESTAVLDNFCIP